MMVFASVWIIFSLISLGHVDDVKDLQNEWISMSKSEQSMSRIKNIATLVTYYDDFFVPSGKLKARRKLRDNITQSAYMKGYALKNPSDLTKMKFDDIISNNIFHRDGIIKARESLKEQRKKRGVLHLYNMVSCATGCDPLGYIGYGCYCGFLGSGYPVDGIDRCCERHDRCYKHASCPILEYIIPYFWKCYYTHPICALDHAEYGGPGSCASRLCECDRILSECLSRYPCPSAKTFCRSSPFRLLHNALSIFP